MTPTDVVDRYLERLAAGDVDGVAACFDEHAVDFFVPHAPGVPWIPSVSDRSGVRAFFAALRDQLDNESFEVEDRVTSDEDVVLRGRLRSIVRSTGRAIESRFAIWIGVEGGRINRYHLYEDSYQVALAAGLL